jgi:hypothetical protein
VKKNAKMNNARYVGIVLRSVPREGGTDLLAPTTCLGVNFAHIRQTHSWTSQYSSGNERYRVRAVSDARILPGHCRILPFKGDDDQSLDESDGEE